jgi:protein involved in ribonucleotide reduction
MPGVQSDEWLDPYMVANHCLIGGSYGQSSLFLSKTGEALTENVIKFMNKTKNIY